ncbi:MAG: hypothetical protein JW909_10300 [Planctomycetes bacterium]|nr:hypothetical protein [Planctomycetota bacterium]
MPGTPLEADGDTYRGFSLRSVCWGYRKIFENRIEQLFAEGAIGPDRPEITERFFQLLKTASQPGHDTFLKEFLYALNPRTCWLMDLPAIFHDVTDTALKLAGERIYHGVAFFRFLGAGSFGDNADELRTLLAHVNNLMAVDRDLAFAFAQGYSTLRKHLKAKEVSAFVDEGLAVFRNNRETGTRFMSCMLRSSDNVIRALSGECRLADVQEHLRKLLHALTARKIEIADISQLDSDYLLERGTGTVALAGHLYVPARIRHHESADLNGKWYLLVTALAAAFHLAESFPAIHGAPGYESITRMVGEDARSLNVFQLIEYARVLRTARKMWPGLAALLDFFLAEDLQALRSESHPDMVMAQLLMPGEPQDPDARSILAAASASVNCFDTAAWVTESDLNRRAVLSRALGERPLSLLSFLPDMLYPAYISAPPDKNLIADLKRAARRRRDTGDKASAQQDDDSGDAEFKETDREEEAGVVEAAFVYDEWSQAENDYYRDYCLVREQVPSAEHPAMPVDDETAEQSRHVRRLLEMIKPSVATREKRLEDGDIINHAMLVDYLVQKRKEPSPKVNFYEKSLVNRRDVATLVLMDISGSTRSETTGRKVIDIEKRSAFVLGEGLAGLGDRFSICGFSGSGRDNCIYMIYKDFSDSWNSGTRTRLMSARPMSSTRIGPALRHSGYRLSKIDARHRLIILITDGLPMDTGYDPNTRYAQHDVRMACEENLHQYVHTFGICTAETSIGNMEIMFPGRRFAVMPDICRLPKILPGLYLKLTL